MTAAKNGGRRAALFAGLVVVAGALVTQAVRGAWPFSGRTPASGLAAPAADPHAGHGTAGSPAGYAPVMLDERQAAAMGLKTAAVAEHDLTRVLRTVGVIALDETRTAHVHTRVRGWIDTIHVDFVGRKVRAGEALCTIYSQEVYAAENEYLAILERAAGKAGTDPLLAAARRRLALWDVPRGEIERLERTREPRQSFPLLAPRSGVVVAKQAVAGMYVDASLELYTLADLTHVWAVIDVYEADVPYVHLGDLARLTVAGQEAPIAAKVAFLAPAIDEATRTRKVRLELDNAGGALLPGAFATAELTLAMGKALAVPESAVIWTGARAIVFVVHGDDTGGHVVPREVTLGPRVDGLYRVEAGLVAGDKVAVGAQFLLDSESRLRATSAPGGGHVH